MWFEAVPSFGIILACLTMPHIVTYATNRLFLGNGYKRRLATYDDAHNYLRDMRISGTNDAYRQIDLNCLPEEEVKEVKEVKEAEVKIC